MLSMTLLERRGRDVALMDDNINNNPSAGKILSDQVDELYKNLSYANWSVILISSFMLWILWPVANREHLLFWDAYILLIVLIREDVAIRYKKTTDTLVNTTLWLRLYVAGTFLSGIGWGLSLIFIVPSELFIYLVTTSFLVCGLVTGSAATLASLKYGFAVFSIPAILPGALYLMYRDGANNFNVGISLLVFLVFILFIAFRMHKTIYYSLKKQVEVGSKLSDLEMEKQVLESRVLKLQDDLEIEKLYVEKFKEEIKQWQYPDTKVRQIGGFKDARVVSLLESLQGGVWDMNLKTGEVAFSEGWLKMLGYNKEDAPRDITFWESILHPDDKLEVLNKLNAFSDVKNEVFSSCHRLRTGEGDWIWVMATANGVVWGSYGELLNVIGMEVFLPDLDAYAEKSFQTVKDDKHSSFFSTDKFHARLEHLVKTASIDGIEHSFCHLKIIRLTDQLNQDISLEEIVLYEVSRVLLKEFRQGDTIIRMGSESFVMLMEFCNAEDAWEKAFTLKKSLNALDINIKGEKYRITVAIGIMPITNSEKTAAEIMQDAEHACNLAIIETSNLIYLYQKDGNDSDGNMFEKLVAKKIRACITNNEIRISAVPLMPLRNVSDSEELASVSFSLEENLNENFQGADYSAIVRKNYLSLAIDIFVIRNVFEWLKNNVDVNGDKGEIFFYECSVISFQDERFIKLVIEELESHPKVNSSFCLGVSEKYFLENPEMMEIFLQELKSTGTSVALTDVGSTSMTVKLLQDHQVDYLKIDKSILQNFDKEESNFITIKYINDICHLKGMKSIIDEVNEASLREVLDTLKIDYMQKTADLSSEIIIK